MVSCSAPPKSKDVTIKQHVYFGQCEVILLVRVSRNENTAQKIP